MTTLTTLTLEQAAKGLSDGTFSAVELTQAHIEALAAARDLNAFITETPEMALEQAKESDARRAKGDAKGLMDGLPIANKDLFCTEGVLTTAASHILDGFTPTYESTVTANLKSAGTVMLGKTNLDEFAMGSATVTSYYGPTKNPWRGTKDKDLVPGGSSGGSAAAVAAQEERMAVERLVARWALVPAEVHVVVVEVQQVAKAEVQVAATTARSRLAPSIQPAWTTPSSHSSRQLRD